MKIVAIIPARFDSRRFPGKPLIDIKGKTMIQRVYEQATKLSILSEVIIATDDDRIMNHVRSFGASVYMTSKSHISGTDRVAEVASKLKGIDIILNIQGDEPFIMPEQIQLLCDLFNDPKVEIGSLVTSFKDGSEINDKNIVKAWFDENNYAVGFTRHVESLKSFHNSVFYKHLGIYGFRREILLKLTTLKPGKLEQIERLEQLRWMENEFKIKLGISEFDSFSIDTPEDLKKIINKS